MERIAWILTAIFGGAAMAILAALLSVKGKNRVLQMEIEDEKAKTQTAEIQLEKQKEIVKAFEDALTKGNRKQQKISEKEEKLMAEKKEAQTSEEPIKKSISFGNDVVGGFNSSK